MMSVPYVAGLFDGEGCFQICGHRKGMIPRVLIVNTNLEVLEKLKKKFGGDISPLARRKSNWRESFQWRLSNAAALHFMEKISPCLIVKKDQAILARVYFEFRGGKGVKWGPGVIELFKDQSKHLNWRGEGRPEMSPMELAIGETQCPN